MVYYVVLNIGSKLSSPGCVGLLLDAIRSMMSTPSALLTCCLQIVEMLGSFRLCIFFLYFPVVLIGGLMISDSVITSPNAKNKYKEIRITS